MLETMLAYKQDPMGFWEKFGSYKPFEFGEEIAEQIATQDMAKIAIKSTPGAGKSALMANLILWFTQSHWRARVPTTAPTMYHLMSILWGEIDLWFYRSSAYPNVCTLTKTKLAVNGYGTTWNAIARTSRREKKQSVAYGLQGLHSPNMLFVIDEAHAIPDKVYKAVEDSFLHDSEKIVVVAIGNAYEGSQNFKRAFNADSDWLSHTITYQDSPIINQARCENIITQLGANHPKVRTSLFAEFCDLTAEGFGMLIPSGLLSKAMVTEDYSIPWEEVSEIYIGVDPARLGKNMAAIAPCLVVGDKRYFADITLIPKITLTELMRVVDEVASVMTAKIRKAQPVTSKYVETTLVIDERGLGGGVVDMAIERGYNVVPFDSARKAQNDKRYVSMRAESFGRMRRLLDEGLVTFPDCPKAISECAFTEYHIDKNGKIALTSKDAVGAFSDESSDALDAMTMAVYLTWMGEEDV